MTAPKRIRPADDPHRSEPRAKRKRKGVEVMLSDDTRKALADHVRLRERSAWVEGAILQRLARERES